MITYESIRQDSTSVYLDANGYPTYEYLQFLRNYEPMNKFDLTYFLLILADDGWWAPDWGVVIKRENDKLEFELHTGGWSGNEEIIREILANDKLKKTGLHLVKHEKGGHFYFTVDDNS